MMILGSATELPLADESVATVICSPPYNVGIFYGDYDDVQRWQDYKDMVYESVYEMHRVMIPGSRIWVNLQPTVPLVPGQNQERFPLANLWFNMLSDLFNFRDQIVWIQDSFDGGCAWGSWLSPSGPNLRGGHEVILSFSKGDWKRETPPEWKGWKGPKDDLGGTWTDLVRNVWTMRPAPRKSGPAPFPIDLPARCIRLSTWPGEVVLDPFAGTGTTVKAAEQLGRIGVGVDISRVQLGQNQDGRPEDPAGTTGKEKS